MKPLGVEKESKSLRLRVKSVEVAVEG